MSSATVEGDLRLVRVHRDCLGPSQRSLVYGRLRIGNLDRAGQRDDDEHTPLGSRDVAYVVAHLLDGHVSEALNVREHRVLRVHGKPWGAVARREREEAPMAPSSVERDPGLGRLHHEFLGTGKRRLGYGRLGKRSPLSVICSAGTYSAPIVFEDNVCSLVFSAARISESPRYVDCEVGVDFAVTNSRKKGAGRPHTLGYGRLCEALPFFPCGADVLAPICPLTVIREVDLNEYVVRGASEGEQKAVLV